MAAPTTAANSLDQEHARLFRALEEASVPFCLLRPVESLSSASGDVDILFLPSARTASQQILEQLGYRLLRSERHNPGKRVFLRWTGTRAVYVDAHYAVVSKGLEYLDVNRVMAARRLERGVPVPAAPDLAVILFLHDLIGKGRLQSKYLATLRALWPAVRNSEALLDARQRGLGDLIPNETPDLETLLQEPRSSQLSSVMRRAIGGSPNGFGQRLRRRLARHMPPWRKGFVVALLGPDGSGKSSTLEHLERLLREELHWPVSSIYMGPWGHDLFDSTTRLRCAPPPTWQHFVRLRALRLSDGVPAPSLGEALRLELARRSAPLPAGHEVRRLELRDMAWSWVCFPWLRGHVRYCAFLTMLLVEFGGRYAAIARWKRQSRVVLCDRYVYDLMTGDMHSLTTRYGWARRVLVALVPRPDCSVLLWNDAATLHVRKPQLPVEKIEAFQAVYRDLAERHGFITMRTDRSAIEVARRIVDEIVPAAVERLRR